MPLLLGTHYRLAYDQVTRNRGRSFLTGLGIAIGVASIILILSLMGSVKNLLGAQTAEIADNLLLVRPSTNQEQTAAAETLLESLTQTSQYLSSNLNLKDIETIKSLGAEKISAAAPLAASVTTLTTERLDESDKPYAFTIDSASLVATSKDLETAENFKLKSGTFFGSDESGNTAVIGRDLSLKLFGTQDSIGRTFSAFGLKFLITGLLSVQDNPVNYNNIDFDNSVLVSAKYLESQGKSLQIQQINVKTTTKNLEALKSELTEKLKTEKSGDTNFTVLAGDEIAHPAARFLTLISAMLTVVASISLVVGGIGIMNIMLVSVAERTREIGIRKSVGATSGNILLQFLFESLILSSLGGVGGLALGYLLAFLLSVVTPFSPYLDINILMITLATSVGVGLIFGLYPAVKAARKTPISSLRYYH